MDVKELNDFLGNHCRFKFRDGRDIFGVIWEKNSKFFFSSKERHDSLLRMQNNIVGQNSFHQIDPSDILLAEKIFEESA